MKPRNIVALATLGVASIAGPVGYIGCKNLKTDQAIVRELTGDIFIDSLITKLHDRDAHVRRYAARQLSKTKNPIIEKALLSVLNDTYSEVRKYGAQGLGNIKSKEAVQPLILLLNDSESDVILAAVSALGEIGDKAATKPLCNILMDNGEKAAIIRAYNRLEIINALGKIKDKEAMPALEDYLFKTMYVDDIYATARALNSISRENTIKILLENLKSEDTHKVRISIDVLAFLETKQANPSLIPLLDHKSEDVRSSVVQAFSQIGDESVVKPLCNHFYKDKDHIQTRIIFALSYINSKESVLPLIEFMNHEEEYIRGNIAMILGNIGDKRAIKTLCNRLKYDDSPQVRIKAAEALGKIADPASLETLQEVRRILDEYQGSRDLKEKVQEAIFKIKSQNQS